MTNIALIGCGYWGKNIARNFYELGTLTAICDSDKDMQAVLKGKYPEVQVTSDLNSVLKSKKVKALAIATPAATHYDIVKKALIAGKDVFVEKPLALTVQEGKTLKALAEKYKRVLMVVS
jgi:UDP-2-acetamido-3-amino-2,3-dideoxy-glucuronate N-acetyltransferase